jgi:hypothetical protein
MESMGRTPPQKAQKAFPSIRKNPAASFDKRRRQHGLFLICLKFSRVRVNCFPPSQQTT